MEIKKLDINAVSKNYNILKEMYYQNAISCSFMHSFSYNDAEKKIDDMKRHIADNTAICYGLFDERSLVGYIWAYNSTFRDEHRVYISEIHILQKYRGNGYGKKLIQCVEKEAEEQGILAVYIHAEAKNEGAIRLYKMLGFETERIQLRKALVED